jgi:serine/threonine-protein kinase RsbT
MSVGVEGEVPIVIESDIVIARRTVREVATQAGFGSTEVTRIVTAASELARNIFQYAGQGSMHWRPLRENGRSGLELMFLDKGPGIADVDLALQEGYSNGKGLGLGLPGAKRLMDEMAIQSKPAQGTKITVKKWRKP